ncbi:MAG: Cys-tRNA(Pro) deacylase [Lachnospiraceae bacterium]|nr:Cys-tRNA(Pro) deacylase [Lachnospiraceae bacterium]
MGKKDKGDEKTNVMRLLEQKKIPYQHYNYVDSGAVNGEEVAKALNMDPNQVFKTLVTVGKTKAYYVFVLPVNKELNLKKAAAAVGEKSIEMLKLKDLLPLTGYVHGGCSPIGMKKAFPTVLHESCKNFETIMFSGGKIGYQVEVEPKQLEKFVRLTMADIVDDERRDIGEL